MNPTDICLLSKSVYVPHRHQISGQPSHEQKTRIWDSLAVGDVAGYNTSIASASGDATIVTTATANMAIIGAGKSLILAVTCWRPTDEELGKKEENEGHRTVPVPPPMSDRTSG